MKKIFKILTLCVPLVLSGACIWAQDSAEESGTVQAEKVRSQKVSASIDFLRTDINAEYSSNQYLDFGIGYTPFAFFIIPASEEHFFARVCFLDYFIQPYLQLGVSFVAPGQIDDNTEWFNARVGTGVKFTFGERWYLGVGGGYCFAGQNLMPTSDLYGMNWHGFYPSVFLGYTVKQF